jgi:hypothetical protein
MEQKREHQSSRKIRIKKQTAFERFLSSSLFFILGTLSLVAGAYSLATSGSGFQSLVDMFLGSLTPAAEKTVTAGLPTAGSTVLRAGSAYPSFPVASLILFAVMTLIHVAALRFRSETLLIISCLFFYLPVLFFSTVYLDRPEYLLGYVLLFTLSVTLVGLKIKKSVIHLVNQVFVYGFTGLFWLVNFVVNQTTGLLPHFFIAGILFYLFFYVLMLFASKAKEPPFPKWIQLVISWNSLAFFLGTTSYIIFKYYGFGYLPVLVIALLIINILVIFLIQRNQKQAWSLPHYYTAMALASLVLPLVMRHHMILLFSAILSMLMLAYYTRFKVISSLWISLIATTVMIVFFVVAWMTIYLPAIFEDVALPPSDILIHGILSGILTVAALFGTKWLLKDQELPLPKQMFGKRKHYRLVRSLLLISLFVTMGWIAFITVGVLTGNRNSMSVGWFISGSLFFIGMIMHYAGRQSAFKKPILYLAMVFCLSYPLMVHLNMVNYRVSLLMMRDLSLTVLLIHVFALVTLVILGRMVIKRINRHHVKNMPLRNALSLLTASFVMFLLCTWYDNLTVIFNTLQSSQYSQTGSETDFLTTNKYLPYSVIIWIITVWVFLRAVVQRNRVIRDFAVIIYAGLMIKIFAFDFDLLTQGAKSIVFLVLGLFLVGFAIVYPRLLKGKPVLPEMSRSRTSTTEKKR